MSTNTAFDLLKIYKTYFNNTPYFISDTATEPTKDAGYSITTENPNPRGRISYNSKNIAFNKIGAYGQSIWFPIALYKAGKQLIEIDACTAAVNLSKIIVKTPVSERQGSVKECFSIDDYRFTIKGFLIGKNRQVPEDQILALKEWFETKESIELKGGYVELFLEASCSVAVTTLDFPEVQGKAVWIRPFAMTVETDYVQNLVLE